MKLSEYQASAARHVMVYGGPKTGKTELVGTLSKKWHLWWMCFDDGVKTLTRPDSFARNYLDNIELFNIPDSQIWPIGITTMLKVIKGDPCNICHKHGAVACPMCKDTGFSRICLRELDVKKDILVIDHYTQLMDSVVNNTWKKELAADNFDIKSTFDDWAKQGAISDRLGSTIQVAPYNCVVISHEVLTEMEDGTKKVAPVGGTRNKSADFGRYFDDVVYTEIVGGQYKASMHPGDKSRVVIGSRSGKRLTPAKAGEQQTLLELFE